MSPPTSALPSRPSLYSAAVTSPAGAVSQGTETFTLLNGSNQVVAPPVTVNVTTSAGLANYTLPGGTAAGAYTIEAVYNGTVDFAGSSDTTHSLTVSPASSTTAAQSQTATYSRRRPVGYSQCHRLQRGRHGQRGDGDVPGPQRQHAGRQPRHGHRHKRLVTATYTLPAGTAVGTYNIQATFNGSTDYTSYIDSSHS